MSSSSSAPEPGDPQPPLRKGQRTRLHILQTAGQLLSGQTPASIKMDDIAYAAKVSVGTLYKYFSSKEALFLAYTADAYDVLDRYRGGIKELKSPMERVYAAGDAYLRFAVERPAFVRFMMVRGLQPADEASLAAINEGVASRIQEMVLGAGVDLREAMQVGEIPTVPLDELVVMLFGLWNGVASLVVRADSTAIPPELAWRAVERSRIILHHAVIHQFASPDEPPPPWELER